MKQLKKVITMHDKFTIMVVPVKCKKASNEVVLSACCICIIIYCYQRLVLLFFISSSSLLIECLLWHKLALYENAAARIIIEGAKGIA
jgi:hypothetical protein